MNHIIKKGILVLIITFSVSGCGREKDNFDIDISKLNLPKKVIKSQPNDSEVKSDKESIIYKLKALKSKDEVINNINYGKQDPFSKDNIGSKITNFNFQLNGFISVKEKNYAFVNYNGKNGIININSVGGVNTKMLPKNAFVKDINPSQEIISLSIEGEIYTIELKNIKNKV